MLSSSNLAINITLNNYCDWLSLYDEGTVTNTNEKVFDSSNYTTRSRKGQGSISGTEKTRSNESFACYKLVGAEFLEDVAQMSRLRGRN